MTNRGRFDAWCSKFRNWTPQLRNEAWETWQAAERDMLERCIAVVTPPEVLRRIDGKTYSAFTGMADKLKELLNDRQGMPKTGDGRLISLLTEAVEKRQITIDEKDNVKVWRDNTVIAVWAANQPFALTVGNQKGGTE